MPVQLDSRGINHDIAIGVFPPAFHVDIFSEAGVCLGDDESLLLLLLLGSVLLEAQVVVISLSVSVSFSNHISTTARQAISLHQVSGWGQRKDGLLALHTW